MPDTMKAVVYYAPGDIRVEQVDMPVCGNDEIRVKIDILANNAAMCPTCRIKDMPLDMWKDTLVLIL